MSYFDPLDALQLRVDDERPSLGARENRGVLGRHAVVRQTLVVPRRYLRVVRQQRQRI